MIYDKLIVITSRTGRQYKNTCDLCVNLKKAFNIDNNPHIVCSKYPAMDNNVRCIDYIAKKTRTQTKFNLQEN